MNIPLLSEQIINMKQQKVLDCEQYCHAFRWRCVSCVWISQDYRRFPYDGAVTSGREAHLTDAVRPYLRCTAKAMRYCAEMCVAMTNWNAFTQGRADHCTNIFLLRSWTSTDDLDLRTWPRYSQVEPSCQICRLNVQFSSKVTVRTHTHRHAQTRANRTDCFTWTTEAVGKSLAYSVSFLSDDTTCMLLFRAPIQAHRTCSANSEPSVCHTHASTHTTEGRGGKCSQSHIFV